MAGLLEKGRSEFEGCLSVRDGQLNINMQSRNLDDAGIENWCTWMDDCLPDFVKNKRLYRREEDGFLLCREANFASNAIGDLGGRALLRVLFTHKIAVRVVKLFKNNLGRAFASSMMDWLTFTPVPAIELHLSHNYIPREGAVDILKAVGHNKVYPAKNGNGSQQPLWLRLEQNIVEKPNELLQVAEEQLMKIRGGKRGAILSMDNIPKTVPADAPCPLAQVAYLINQRDHRFRVPPQAQRWKAQSGPREANRWRISITPEQAELAAKAPSMSVARRPSDGPEARESGPVWNGLPVSEQLQAAAMKGQAMQLTPDDEQRSSESNGGSLCPPVEDTDSDENSDEAPGPVLKRHQSAPPKAGLLCKAPPVEGLAAFPQASNIAPAVKAPPGTANPLVKAPPFPGPNGGAFMPPPSGPPPKPPPAVRSISDTTSLATRMEEENEYSLFSSSMLGPSQAANPPEADFFTDLTGYAQASSSDPLQRPPMQVSGVGPPPGLQETIADPKGTNCEVPEDFFSFEPLLEPMDHSDIALRDRRPRPSPVPDSGDEDVQDFLRMVQDPVRKRTNRFGRSIDQADVLNVDHNDPNIRAKEVDFSTDLNRIKETYLRLGREEFMRRILMPEATYLNGFS